jgi:hypothetical protein
MDLAAAAGARDSHESAVGRLKQLAGEGRSDTVKKRLRMSQHADTDVQIKTQAVLTPRRSRIFSHEPFIINKQK